MKTVRLLKSLFPIFLVLVLVLIHSIALCADKSETLKIGFLAGLTGFASDTERIYPQGAEMASEYINNRGGITIKGQRYLIELIIEDDRCTADGTVAAAKKLVYDLRVKFIAGTIMPFIVSAAATVTEPAGVVRAVLWNCATPAELGPNTPYTFLVQPGTIEMAIGGLKYLTEAYPKAKRIVMINPDDGAIPHISPIVKDIANKYGISVLGDIVGFPLDTIDYTPFAIKAIARDPDGIAIMNGWPQNLGFILKAGRERGYNKPIFGCAFTTAQDVAEVAGKEVSTDFFCLGSSATDPYMPPLMKEIMEKAQAKYGHQRVNELGRGFDGVWSIAQAIEAAQSLDPDVVKKSWEKMDKIETLFGTGRMGGLKTYGIRHAIGHPLPVSRLVEGKVVNVNWIKEVVSP